MPNPQTPWEQMVDRAMRTCSGAFGEGADEDGLPRIAYRHHGEAESYLVADGIFEATTEAIDLETGSTVLSNEPRLSVALSLLQAVPAVGDTLTLRDTLYRVVEPMFDGQGTVSLRLHFVGPAPVGGP